jgi:hypothetical protein
VHFGEGGGAAAAASWDLAKPAIEILAPDTELGEVLLLSWGIVVGSTANPIYLFFCLPDHAVKKNCPKVQKN